MLVWEIKPSSSNLVKINFKMAGLDMIILDLPFYC